MCGDRHVDHSLSALIEILAKESDPLSMTMRRMATGRLRELQRLHGMMRLVTGRDDWQRMTLDEWEALRNAQTVLPVGSESVR
jgi:hypothetical protein